MKIDIKAIKELAKNVEKYGLEEVTLESEGTKISLKREIEKEVVTQTVVTEQQPVVATVTPTPVAKAPTKVATEETDYLSVDSPMVGTYYGAPSPDADAFVKEGQVVEEGETLCIVEAMKLMNEVKAEKKCKIIKALLVDGAPVTKGAKLFLIEEV